MPMFGSRGGLRLSVDRPVQKCTDKSEVRPPTDDEDDRTVVQVEADRLGEREPEPQQG